MPDQESIAEQEALLETHRRTLSHLLSQEAVFGPGYVPSQVAHGIASARAGIRQAKRILRGWGVAIEDHPDDDDLAPGHEVPPFRGLLPFTEDDAALFFGRELLTARSMIWRATRAACTCSRVSS